jgi:peptide/nickel transport system ATP-binding protein
MSGTDHAATDLAPLIEARGLTKHFRIGGAFSGRVLHAVDGADFVIDRKEIVALVGESGSGKSTVARLLARVYRPTAGEIRYQGRSLAAMRTRRQSLAYRSDVPMVFQDPFSSLNPAYRVSHGIMRGLKLHRTELRRAQRHAEAERVVEAVGLVPAAEILDRYPYELSGGQRQRIGFAQALAYRPTLILADEPVSMLDVSIRVGLLNVMAALREKEGVSFLYITHDIASARYISERLMVMYAGHLVESGPTETVLADPKHPYTRLLLSAVPDPRAPLAVDAEAGRGEPPRVIDPTEGCRFRWRCPLAVEECSRVTPLPRQLGPAHSAACHVATPDPATPDPATPDPATPDPATPDPAAGWTP